VCAHTMALRFLGSCSALASRTAFLRLTLSSIDFRRASSAPTVAFTHSRNTIFVQFFRRAVPPIKRSVASCCLAALRVISLPVGSAFR
jgi:hypothetical protein